MSRVTRNAMVAVVALMLTVGTGAVKYDSARLDRDVQIDGVMDEWSGLMTPLGKTGLALGMMNDGEYLYICVVSQDWAANRQILGRGLTLWLDPGNNVAERFGIRYPVGLPRSARPRPQPGERPDTAAMEAMARESLGYIEVVLPDGEPLRYAVEDALGIVAVAEFGAGKLTYELMVPLQMTEVHPHALGLEPGDAFKVVLESRPPDPAEMQGRGGRGGRSSGGGGSGGGMRGGSGGGRMGGGRGSGGASRPEPIKVKVKVRLAT